MVCGGDGCETGGDDGASDDERRAQAEQCRHYQCSDDRRDERDVGERVWTGWRFRRQCAITHWDIGQHGHTMGIRHRIARQDDIRIDDRARLHSLSGASNGKHLVDIHIGCTGAFKRSGQQLGEHGCVECDSRWTWGRSGELHDTGTRDQHRQRLGKHVVGVG